MRATKAIGLAILISVIVLIDGCHDDLHIDTAMVPNLSCSFDSVRLSSRIVDERVISRLLGLSAWSAQESMYVPPAIAWLPHRNQLVLSWARGNVAQGEESSVIALIGRDGRDCHVVARGFAPQPSPDGKEVAYLARDSGHLFLHVMNSDGSGQIQIATGPDGIHGSGWGGTPVIFAWSPDSRFIAYATHPGYEANPLVTHAGAGSSRSNVHVFRSNAPYAGGQPGGELHVVRPDGAQDRLLKREARGIAITSLSWENPHTVLYNAIHYYSGHDFHSIKTLNISSARTRTILTILGMQNDYYPVPVYHNTAVLYTNDPVFRSYGIIYDMVTTSIKTGKTKTLTRDFKTLNGEAPPQWDDTHEIAYFLGIHDSVYARIYRVQQDELPQMISAQPEDVEAFALSPDTAYVAWIGRDAVDHLRVRVSRVNGSDVQTLVELHPFVNSLHTSQVEEFHYLSRDGLRLPALLVKPLGYQPGRRYPLIAQIHGGGWSSHLTFDGTIEPTIGPLEWQFWAAKGYALVITDYRITGTYGRAAVLDAMERQDYYERDADDVLGAVDYAIARGIADPRRLGVFGFSYGGVHTNFMITYTRRFRAAISYEGWGDEFMHAATLWRCDACYYLNEGTPWGAPENYFRESSVFHVKGVKTATLFVSGDPIYGSEPRGDNEFFYAALRDQGVPAELVQYDDEGHGLFKVDDQLDLLRRAASWFDTYLMHPAL